MTDPTAAREAFQLAEQVGWVRGARQLRVARRTLRAAFARWGLGEPTPPPGPYAPSAVARDRAAAEEALQLAIQVGVRGAAERLGWTRPPCTWRGGGGGWAGRPTARRAPGRRRSGCWPSRAVLIVRGIRGSWTARSGSRSGRPEENAGSAERPTAHRPVSARGDRPGRSRVRHPVVSGQRTRVDAHTGQPGRLWPTMAAAVDARIKGLERTDLSPAAARQLAMPSCERRPVAPSAADHQAGEACPSGLVAGTVGRTLRTP